jgi:hypothetical protein
MKARTGFVSNSSSSSFIIDADRYTVDQVKKVIELGLEAEKVIGEYAKYDREHVLVLDQICTIKVADNCEDFLRQMREFYCVGINPKKKPTEWEKEMRETYAQESRSIKATLENRKCIVVDSTRDNSIPYRIQETLSSLAAHRQHWG